MTKTDALLPHAVLMSAGDFSDLVARSLPRLKAYARSLTRDATLTEDLVQDALIRAWAARARFAPGTNFAAWITRILRNCFLSHKRKDWREVTLDVDAGTLSAALPADQETAIMLNELNQALDQLSANFRNAFLLIAREGFSYDRVAEILGVPPGTVRSRVSRARAELIRRLGRELPDVRWVPDIGRTPAKPDQPEDAPLSVYQLWKASGSRMIG